MPGESPRIFDDRRVRIAVWVGGALLALLAAAGLLLALPYGVAAALMKPALDLVDGGRSLPDDLDRPPERSVVLATDGSELATLSGEENRVAVALSQVPQVVRDAVLAIEDADFRAHAGVDHRAVARAALANLRAGGIVQGGSTITQQYVKNAILSAAQTADRKTTEMRFAIELERRLDKDEILQRYLNIAYFGEGVYGIATAAEYYYSKGLDELSIDEAATLAGLINQPERLNPAEAPEAAADRRDVVLDRMVDEGFISAEQAATARDQPVEVSITPLPPTENPFFVEHVKRLLFDDPALGPNRDARERAVYEGGLEVTTTLDPRLQEAAEAAIAERLTDPAADPLAAVVTIEPTSGAVRALAVGPKEFGGCPDDADECAATQVNPAVPGIGGSGRQPGSAFKPVLIAAALQEGIPPGWQDITDSGRPVDGCTDDGEPWTPTNYDPGDGGVKDMAEAVTVSNNVYHALLMGRVQPEPVVTMAERLGIPDDGLPAECALALGAGSVYPLHMAVAFATFANGGTRCAPSAIEQVVRDDVVLVEQESSCEEAIPPETALRVTDLLRGPVESGTATAAQLDRPVAGKTGTTDDFRDAWFVGYVPQLVTATWVGFAQPRPMEQVLGVEQVTGGTVPAELWRAYMEEAVADLDPAEFEDPPPLEPITVPEAVGGDVDAVGEGLGVYDLHIVPTEVTDWRPAGTVIRQDPDPGVDVAPGHLLTLDVSDGTGEPPPVPDVRRLPEEEARAAFDDAGYDVEVRTERHRCALGPDDDVADLDPPDGTVGTQDPAANTPLRPGETVTVTIVRYDVDRAVPNVVGLPEPEAVTALQEAGWAVEVATEQRRVQLGPDEDPADLDPPDGSVVDQAPPPDTPLEPGEQVRVVVVRYDVERVDEDATEAR